MSAGSCIRGATLGGAARITATVIREGTTVDDLCELNASTIDRQSRIGFRAKVDDSHIGEHVEVGRAGRWRTPMSTTRHGSATKPMWAGRAGHARG